VPIERVLRVAITIEVNVMKGTAVSGQELLRPKCLPRCAPRRADHDHAAQIVGNQFETAQDERAHANLAHLRVCLYEREQLFADELDHFAGLGDARTSECVATAAWSWPVTTTNTGTAASPTSTNTSPRVVVRRRPWAAILATCPDVSVGNTRSGRVTVAATGVTAESLLFIG